MKTMKKIMLSLFFVLAIFTSITFSVKAADMVPIPKWGGGYITYRGTSTQILMPAEYIEPDTSFRAVWVSNVVGDIATYANEDQYKAEMMRVFDTMEYYNMNAIIFHVRTHHDAMYKSSLNRLSPNFSGVDFDEFDPLEWMIGESHRRGIEFHAWMNPYRVGAGTPESIAAKFPAHNPASSVSNLLSGNQNVILNPGSPAVREFLIDTVMEVVENYDIDGIHFDDYFYENGVDDSATRALYNTENLSVANFRRKQIDIFIEDLHETMSNYNDANQKAVQLGISPSGIYRNGSYVPAGSYQYDNNGHLTYPLASNSSGYSHYDAPLYADTLKWVNNDWIDYIVPQVYWSFDLNAAPHGDIVEWWNGALKHTNVNLYIGTALYTAGGASGNGWTHDRREFANEVQFASGLSNVNGQVIFSFSQLYSSLRPSSAAYYHNMHNVKNEMWYRDAILPEVRTMDPVNLPAVKNFKLGKTQAGYRIDFDGMDAAKTYAIYRSESPLTYDVSELIEVIGKKEINGKIHYIDNISTSKNYYYGVKAISRTNTIGAGASLSTTTATPANLIPVGNLPEIVFGDTLFYNTNLTLKWEKIVPNFGDDLVYTVYTSTDGDNFVKNGASVNLSGNTHSTNILIGESDILYVYFNVKNNISSQDSEVYILNVKENIGPITSFSYSGSTYAGDEVVFKWNALNSDEDITYKLQTSSNQDQWRDVEATISQSGNKVTAIYKFPNNYSNNYYRVLATDSKGSGFSTSIRIASYEKIDALNLKYQGQAITEPIYVNQNEMIEFTWDNLTHSSGEVTYRANMSHDLKTWKIARLYDQRNVLTYYPDVTGHTVYPTFEYYILYLQIEANTATANSKSEIIEIRVIPTSFLPRIFLDNYYYQHKTIINRSNIFK